MSIDATLRLLSKASGLSVTDIATAIPKAGVSTVNAWLKGDSLPGKEQIDALARTFGVPAGALLAELASTLDPARTKGSRFDRHYEPGPAAPSRALEHALVLLSAADAVLDSGESIDALVPVLRTAMHAVPEHERDPAMRLPWAVMDRLTADVLAMLPPRGALNDDGTPVWLDGEAMTDEEAAEMGRFWYAVAAGEWSVQ